MRSLLLWLLLASNLVLAQDSIGPSYQSSKEWKNTSEWKPVLKLIDEQKFQAAKKEVEQKIPVFMKNNDEKNWTIALIQKQRLMVALGEAETSVEWFKSAKWPQSLSSQFLLNLYYAQALLNYYNAYSWEINKREQIVSQKKMDLKKWSKQDIFREIQKNLYRIWQQRGALKNTPTNYITEFISEGTYPREVRGTLRDSFTYFYVAFIQNSQFWTPEQSNEKGFLNLKKLLAKSELKSNKLLNKNIHPLQKINILLTDLEQWHWKNDRLSALMEARFELIRVLKDQFTTDENRDEMINFLTRYLRDYKVDSWWSEGMYLKALIMSLHTKDTSQIKAREMAKEAVKAHPGSIGASRAEALISQIEKPFLSAQVMRWDSAQRPSILVTYKNWKKVFFKAYPFQPEKYFLGQKGNILPYGEKLLKQLNGIEAKYSWNVDLPDPGDFRNHNQLVEPKIDKKGFYIILASANDSFRKGNNRLLSLFYTQTNLHPIRRNNKDGFTLKVLDYDKAKPVKDVEVTLFQQNWSKGNKKYQTYKTNARGEVVLKPNSLPNRHNYFYTLKKGSEFALDQDSIYTGYNSYENSNPTALIFTDRSIYRPGQKLHFKVLTFEARTKKLPKAKPNSSVQVYLHDGNGEVVSKQKLKTNKFATASGTFEIPKGRFLGQWYLRTDDHSGTSYIKVEEYKRPTFVAKINDALGEIRLNKKARFKGEVKYYFGLPLKDARVKYKVIRKARYPYWYYWWYPVVNNQVQIVKTGETKSNDKGEFILNFTPKAEKGKKGITYDYKLSVEVLNEGGETVKAHKSFVIGDVAVQASITGPIFVLKNKRKIEMSVRRSDLNGKALPGKASFQLHALTQPKKTLSASEQPKFYGKYKPKKSKWKTVDDLKRSRWEREYQPATLLKSWKKGKKLRDEALAHGKEGLAQLKFDNLKPGPYRITYLTTDNFGGKFETQHNFVIVKKQMDLKLPLVFETSQSAGLIGDVIQFYIKSGYPNQQLYFELYHDDEKLMSEVIQEERLIKYRLAKRDLGGLTAKLFTVADHHFLTHERRIDVPYVSKSLSIHWERLRKKVYPGTKEEWSLIVKSKDAKDKSVSLTEQAEVLAYMYDQSLDAFISHNPPNMAGYLPASDSHPSFQSRNHQLGGNSHGNNWYRVLSGKSLYMDRITIFDSWGIGGFGYRFGSRGGKGIMFEGGLAAAPSGRRRQKGKIQPKKVMAKRADSPMANQASLDMMADESISLAEDKEADSNEHDAAAPEQPQQQIRSNFSETAFFKPHLKTNKKGEVKFSFEVPDSLTAWNVWVNAVNSALDYGSYKETVESVKDLMVRTYFPRFFREGDLISLKVVVDNASNKKMEGKLYFEISDDSDKDISAEFKLAKEFKKGVDISLKPKESKNFNVKLNIPYDRLGQVKLKAFAKTKEFTDGELKTLPILPSRIHLAQSRFVTLKNKETRELIFKDMLKPDKTLIHDSLVVKLDAQLFYSLLSALPYIIDYPYECSEQTLNRYLTTAILSSVYKQFPSIAKMAQKMSKRKTQYEPWNQQDPNRKMGLEETPWLKESRGEGASREELLNMLKPRIVKYQKDTSLKKLLKMQYPDGGFPWFEGGRPSFYMTKYVLYGFAKASEFGVDVPKSSIKKGFSYIKNEYKRLIKDCYAHDTCWEWISFLNFILSTYPDESYYSHAFSMEERKEMLDFSFKHWKRHQPMLKGMLALTLNRMKRNKDAKLVLESVMDSAKEERDLGVYWAPEDRSWLWYNDSIETHAFALRTLTEVMPKNKKKHGLVQWLYLNKKLNHWKSTRATSEVIYSVLHYLKAENLIGSKERAKVKVGAIEKDFQFDPDEYSGKDNFVIVKGKDIKPKEMHKIKVTQATKGMMFASATWHFSTEKLPQEARGDFFNIKRTYFKRITGKKEMKLVPLSEGAKIEVGDQIEVHLSISSKHAAEYVHLRDPRPAGFEPEALVSGYKWDLGLVRYEEIRDSGMNFFFEYLPVGEFTLKHRIRANLAGEFRSHPATLQSVYAPEFNAYSSGKNIQVK